jgi:O-antigen ligase
MLLRQKGGFKGLLAMIVVAGSLYFLLPDEQMARLSEMGDDKTSQLRLDYWNYALKEVIPDNLLIGVGYNNWVPYIFDREPQGIGVYLQIQEVHNIYLQIAAEAGIFGFFVFVLMIIMSFVTNVRTRRLARALDNRLYYNLSYGFDAGMVGYLVAGTFVTVFYYPYFWIQIAMVVMLNNVVALKAEREGVVVAGNRPVKGKRGHGSRGARGVARQSNASDNIR